MCLDTAKKRGALIAFYINSGCLYKWYAYMPYCHSLLMSSPLFCISGVYKSEQDFLYDLKMMWFGLYSRYNNKKDSSGFEHIFAGSTGTL